MITVVSYIALNHFVGKRFSGWLLVLPVFADLVLIGRLNIV